MAERAPAADSEAGESSDGDAPASESALPTRSYLLLIAICGCGDATYMVLAPFFPQRAEEVGLSQTANGLIFSVFMWGGLVVTPIATWLSRNTSSRLLLGTCVLLQAGLTACFALAPLLTKGWQWFAFCFTLRLLQGVIAAIYEVAVSSLIMCSVDVENVGTALGVQEAARGVGLMIGPAVGGILYAAGGFALPFLASAGALALLGGLVFLSLDDETIGDDDSRAAGHLRGDRAARRTGDGAVGARPDLGAVRARDLCALARRDWAGLLGCNFVVRLAVPRDWLGRKAMRRLRGAHGRDAHLGCFLLPDGPVPMAARRHAADECVAARVCDALRRHRLCSATLTCAVPCMLAICERSGFETEEVSDVISGLLSFSWSLGALVGPIYGSGLVQAFGFPEATSETGVLLLALTFAGTAVFQLYEPAPAVKRLAASFLGESPPC
eukprot:CAMPEP_0179912496 /NCGR_PEP_ID=MMETSP0982-20121206/46933_1 /TAXON_ID=483367 /ORGANISM="non described non described, Strain CCMP 2436" /LENGTH=440 /DNA_ID=CAMNT_0021814323 /DNA_START=8 /DNA_END=1327 /DNA_ORIENTATION=-